MKDLSDMTLQELEEHKILVDDALRNFKDGFFYVTVINSYGSSVGIYYHNAVMAMNKVQEYNGDNGNVHLYTSNTNLHLHSYEYENHITYVENDEDYLKKAYKI